VPACFATRAALQHFVKARARPERRQNLLQAVEDGTLGKDSVAFGEYENNMRHARLVRSLLIFHAGL
jgi:hypothetical protein